MKKSGTATVLRVCQPILYAVGWLLFTTAYSQSTSESVGYPPLQIINVEQGLPQAFVSGVVQDDDGFMWVGTLGGIARYDGRQMLPFCHQPDNPASPRSNTVIWLDKGGPNVIWLRYSNGNIDRMNTRTGACQHFLRLAKRLHPLPTVRQFHVNRRGNLWGIILNQGIFRYDIRQGLFTRYRRAANGLVSDTVSALAEDPHGPVRAISPTGITNIDPTGQSLRPMPFATRIRGLQAMVASDERVRAFVRPGGEIMLNNRTHLLFIDPRQMTTRSVAVATREFAADQPLLSQAATGAVYLVAGGDLSV